MKATDLANYILKNSKRRYSNLELQKTIYLSNFNHLGCRGLSLVSDAFEAWQFGPIIPEVYWKYRNYGANSIDIPTEDVDLQSKYDFSSYTKDVIDETIEQVQHTNYWTLVRETMYDGSAWSVAYDNGKKNIISNELILNDTKHFDNTKVCVGDFQLEFLGNSRIHILLGGHGVGKSKALNYLQHNLFVNNTQPRLCLGNLLRVFKDFEFSIKDFVNTQSRFTIVDNIGCNMTTDDMKDSIEYMVNSTNSIFFLSTHNLEFLQTLNKKLHEINNDDSKLLPYNLVSVYALWYHEGKLDGGTMSQNDFQHNMTIGNEIRCY